MHAYYRGRGSGQIRLSTCKIRVLDFMPSDVRHGGSRKQARGLIVSVHPVRVIGHWSSLFNEPDLG
jgi:hypothetical protein